MIIGLDVGGTHTDVVLLGKQGLVNEVKVPTDASNLFRSVLSGLDKITQGIEPSEIDRAVFSTTQTTNAIVQNNLPPIGMIVASGPGVDPEFFRTNDHYYTVSGSIDHRGREIKPIDSSEIKTIAKTLKKSDIQYVGVVSKFSVRNPSHELAIYEILKDDFEKVFLGHRISGNLNFPRRISTTYLNAAVYPIHKDFYEAIIKSIEKKWLNIPLHILKADGGTMSLEASMDFPGQTIVSGPAASIMGSIPFAPENEDCLVLDIGGTTTDMAVLIDRVPVLSPLGINLANYKTLIRSLYTHSIGIGGDSYVRVEDGNLKIGPDRKGPAMAYGGPSPTPTDALCVIGLIKDGDNEKAKTGIQQIADQINDTLDTTYKKIMSEAHAMIDRINSKPVYTIHELQEGYKVDPKQILIIGGPAPYFARHIEEFSGIKVGVVPKWKVANAIGAALARTTCEVVLLADTEQGFASSPEENFNKPIDRSFTAEDAIKMANELLEEKALQKGASPDDLELEVLEELQFNMVRGFQSTGKNIRIKVQVKPGILNEYTNIADML
ncbi:MAG: hydantoinase/oxoprolinase family protein [Deltaproteobacteria bacterium]|nr:hydantoinase/oxoprolinase family protein [Deltaproteobacteria bacterium]